MSKCPEYEILDLFDEITQDMEHLYNTITVLESGFVQLNNDASALSVMNNLRKVVEIQRDKYLKRMGAITLQLNSAANP